MTKTQEIRDLAKRVSEIANSLWNTTKKIKWELHNELKWPGPAPIIVSLDKAWREVLPKDCQGVVDPVYRLVETDLRKKLWYASLGDDRVVEPFVEMTATYFDDSITMWGVEMQYSEIGDSTVFHGEIETPDDINKMHIPIPRMDGTRTLEMYDRARELLYGLLDVRMEWRHRHLIFPNMAVWTTQFIGLEKFMLWCAEQPFSVMRFIRIMAETFIQHNKDMERRGRLTDNHCLTTALGDFPWHGKEIMHPQLLDMWTHSASEEFHLISPEMLEKYLFTFVRPIFAMFAHTSFGCCESLNKKLHLVKTLPNLRRVIISERTDWDYAIDTLGKDFVYVVRPCLVDTIYVNDETQIRKELKRMADTFRGLNWEIMFSGGESFNGDLQRFHKWVRIAKEIINE